MKLTVIFQVLTVMDSKIKQNFNGGSSISALKNMSNQSEFADELDPLRSKEFESIKQLFYPPAQNIARRHTVKHVDKCLSLMKDHRISSGLAICCSIREAAARDI